MPSTTSTAGRTDAATGPVDRPADAKVEGGRLVRSLAPRGRLLVALGLSGGSAGGGGFADLARRIRPKPLSLLKDLIEAVRGPDDPVIDLFAGSGVTDQAAMELNVEQRHARGSVWSSPDSPRAARTASPSPMASHTDL